MTRKTNSCVCALQRKQFSVKFFLSGQYANCFCNKKSYAKTVCGHSKNAKQISRHNSHMNLFILIASSITGDSDKSDDLFFGDHHLFGNKLIAVV